MCHRVKLFRLPVTHNFAEKTGRDICTKGEEFPTEGAGQAGRASGSSTRCKTSGRTTNTI